MQWKREAPAKKERRALRKELYALRDAELQENGLPTYKELEASTDLAATLKYREYLLAARKILKKYREILLLL